VQCGRCGATHPRSAHINAAGLLNVLGARDVGAHRGVYAVSFPADKGRGGAVVYEATDGTRTVLALTRLLDGLLVVAPGIDHYHRQQLKRSGLELIDAQPTAKAVGTFFRALDPDYRLRVTSVEYTHLMHPGGLQATLCVGDRAANVVPRDRIGQRESGAHPQVIRQLDALGFDAEQGGWP
jgi:hypothetical protein